MRFAARVVSVSAGRDVTGFDFRVTARVTIRGKVKNEAKLPVPGATVLLVIREYWAGDIPSAAAATLTVGLTPLSRPPLQGEKRDDGRASTDGH